MHPERLGCFVRRAQTIYRLDKQTFMLVEATDDFNALPPEAKASPDAFIRFATVKGLAEGVGAQLDKYLAEERVLIPSRVGLDLIVEEGGRISFAPKIDGASPEAMRQAFFALDDVDTVYTLDSPEGGRVRVVLDETQREVLRRMQRVRHLRGVERAEVLRDPHSVFDGVRGAQVFLTPRAGDGGIDVIAVREREIRLIQCKHTIWDANVDANVIAEVISAFDGYRARFLRTLPRTFMLCPVLVTNGSFTARARAEVKGRDIRLVANTDLWQLLNETPCTPGDLEAMESRRLASMRDVQVAIERLVRRN